MKKPQKNCKNCRYVGTRDQMAFVPPNLDVYRPVLVMVCMIDPKDVSPSHTCSEWGGVASKYEPTAHLIQHGPGVLDSCQHECTKPDGELRVCFWKGKFYRQEKRYQGMYCIGTMWVEDDAMNEQSDGHTGYRFRGIPIVCFDSLD